MEEIVGRLLLERYRVDRVIGRGGFGYVVQATHLHLGERVAIKFLNPELAADPTVSARFFQEAQAAARLKSHHVVRMLDVGTLPEGSPYIVMEYLEGEDLETLVDRVGRIAPERAAAWILDACEAIAEAHGLGIVHRDLKPANLFLAKGPGREPVVKVLDFGISKFAPAENQSLTRSCTILGSPVYCAPEQLRSTKEADVRSDIWSLGVTLYQLVTGSVPFPGETLSEICMKVATDPVPPLPDALGLPGGLEQVILSCLAKDPAKRYQGLVSFAAALAPFALDRGTPSLRRVAEALGRATVASCPKAKAKATPAPATAPMRAVVQPAETTSMSKVHPLGLRLAVAVLMAAAIAAGVLSRSGGAFAGGAAPHAPPSCAVSAVGEAAEPAPPPAPPPEAPPAEVTVSTVVDAPPEKSPDPPPSVEKKKARQRGELIDTYSP